MKKNIKISSLAVVISFLAIIALGMILIIVLPDREVSYDERRYLADFPEITLDAILDSEYSGELDLYLTDQFPFREFFRKSKAIIGALLGSTDNNGYILDGDAVYKLESGTDEKQVKYAADRFMTMAEKYLSGYDLYYTIIPDKSYYHGGRYPKFDYELIWNTMADNMNADYIDIRDTLTLDSYYRTDTHWRQEAIVPTANALVSGMGITAEPATWNETTIGTFPGVYKAHSGFAVTDDTLVTLTNEHTENAVVFNAETNAAEPVYQTDLISGMDGYDVYLGGASAVLTISNENARTDRELVIFRDSFGSSLVPLMIPYYSNIIVLDLRYVSGDLLDMYADFSGEGDVLFALSTTLLDSARVLR